MDALTRDMLRKTIDGMLKVQDVCADGHVLLDIGPTPDVCQCAGCGSFFPRPGGPRNPGDRQWQDRRTDL